MQKMDGDNLFDEFMFGLMNSLRNMLLKSVSVFIDIKMVGANPIAKYASQVKLLECISPLLFKSYIKEINNLFNDCKVGFLRRYDALSYTGG